MSIARTLNDLGLELPAELRSPTGAEYPFVWVKVLGNRAGGGRGGGRDTVTTEEKP